VWEKLRPVLTLSNGIFHEATDAPGRDFVIRHKLTAACTDHVPVAISNSFRPASRALFPMESIFGNASSATTTRWEPEPTRRGTFGILSSCLITLGLCIWTAVHLNLPARNEAAWDWMCRSGLWKTTWPWPGQTLRKGAWTILGFLAPEVVAYVAYRQYKTASELMADMNELREAETGLKISEWTLTHSYFAVMGGFELALPDASFLPRRLNGRPRTSLILTPTGVMELAKRHPDFIPGLSKQQIQDKSKGDAFAKTVVCFQGMY
jgi:hypothetical protein